MLECHSRDKSGRPELNKVLQVKLHIVGGCLALVRVVAGREEAARHSVREVHDSGLGLHGGRNKCGSRWCAVFCKVQSFLVLNR